MAGAAVDCASDGAMDRTHLFLPGHNGERRPERGQPLVYSHPDRAWFVAGAGAHRAGTGAAAQCVAGRDDTVHVMAGGYLGGGDQRRVPGRDQPDPDTADTVGDLLPVIIGAPILLRSRRLGEVLDAMPATWLIALQVYRVLGSVFL